MTAETPTRARVDVCGVSKPARHAIQFVSTCSLLAALLSGLQSRAEVV